MSGGVPAGWVLVPVEPTLDMRDSATTVAVDTGQGSITALNWEEAAAVWSAMLATTPAPPSRDADVERDAAEAAIAAMRWTDPRMVEDGKRCLAGQRFASFGFGGECFLTASQVEALGRCYDGARAALQALGERG